MPLVPTETPVTLPNGEPLTVWPLTAEAELCTQSAHAVDAASPKNANLADYRRCRSALRFERVISCKCRDLNPTNKDALLNLLAVEFAERDAPAGTVTLTFSGGGAIRLDVECLEAELADLGEVFSAMACPDHFAADTRTA